MEYGLLALIALVVGAGAAGGVLTGWSCHRRVLVLEESIKVYITAFNDRLNEVERIATRDQKREAANFKWSKKAKDEEALAANLTRDPNGTALIPAGHAWDPRTWGRS
jgi:hypothetical protein